MPISIVHVGLPLDHLLIPVEERPKIATRLADLEQRMRAAGYGYEVVYASPELGLAGFMDRLRRGACDGVLIGGGVASDPGLSYFMEQIIDATHQVAPHAKVMFYNHSVPVEQTVARWFPPEGRNEG